MPLARLFLSSLVAFSLPTRALDLLEPHERTRAAQTKDAIRPRRGENWLAIVGDSSVTGAATANNYRADYFQLLTQAFGFLLESQRTVLPARYGEFPSPQEFHLENPIAPLTRVLYSQNEFATAKQRGEVVGINLEAKASLRLDTPEYSFGYMIGRALNIAPEHIVMTGQDGKRINTLARQFERIFEVGSRTLPPLVLVSYVANDFCHPDNFRRPLAAFRAEYEGDVRAELALIAKLPPAPQGTRIVLLAPLDVANIMTNPEVLSQEITFPGRGTITCGELRSGLTENDVKSARSMADSLIGECRGVLEPSLDPAGHIQRVRDLQRTQVEVLSAAVTEFNNNLAPSSLRMQLATSVREVEFKAGDLAGDCFHPGVGGHTRIARQLLQNELKDLATAAHVPAKN